MARAGEAIGVDLEALAVRALGDAAMSSSGPFNAIDETLELTLPQPTYSPQARSSPSPVSPGQQGWPKTLQTDPIKGRIWCRSKRGGTKEAWENWLNISHSLNGTGNLIGYSHELGVGRSKGDETEEETRGLPCISVCVCVIEDKDQKMMQSPL